MGPTANVGIILPGFINSTGILYPWLIWKDFARQPCWRTKNLGIISPGFTNQKSRLIKWRVAIWDSHGFAWPWLDAALTRNSWTVAHVGSQILGSTHSVPKYLILKKAGGLVPPTWVSTDLFFWIFGFVFGSFSGCVSGNVLVLF